jgi:hypothetical protein
MQCRNYSQQQTGLINGKNIIQLHIGIALFVNAIVRQCSTSDSHSCSYR